MLADETCESENSVERNEQTNEVQQLPLVSKLRLLIVSATLTTTTTKIHAYTNKNNIRLAYLVLLTLLLQLF